MEHEYLSLLKRCLASESRVTRNALVQSTFGATLHHDFSDGFPLLTTKKMFFRGVVEELAWFFKRLDGCFGASRGRGPYLGQEYLGPFRGRWTGLWLPMASLVRNIPRARIIIQVVSIKFNFCWTRSKANPHSRRLFMSAWNPLAQPKMCLPPCHVSYQFYVKDNKLSCMMVQRSADVFWACLLILRRQHSCNR